MNPETVRPEPSDYRDTAEMPELEGVNDSDTKLLPPKGASTASTNTQWQEYGERVAAFLQELPRYVTRFFQENRGPLGTIALIVGAIVTVKLTLALLDAMDDIPLVAPTL
ncbi:MAG: hypothetical protein LDL41_20990, partial [Coleofasciculus sp. S288]|nr:hypothetical protein [Coleofasciculus sp. S288]